ncbi:hypothetical protein MRB53_039172 [Persea americana]|nr:hypothetical protein MRB53_039172 [Persea americana]
MVNVEYVDGLFLTLSEVDKSCKDTVLPQGSDNRCHGTTAHVESSRNCIDFDSSISKRTSHALAMCTRHELFGPKSTINAGLVAKVIHA